MYQNKMYFSRLTFMSIKTNAKAFCSSSHVSPVLKHSGIRFHHSKLNVLSGKLFLDNWVFRARGFRNYNYIRSISTSPQLSTNNDGTSIIQLVAESNFVYKVQDILVKLHDVTGLSWWATVAISTLAIRTVFVLPMAIHQHYLTAKLEEINKSLDTTVKADITKQVNDLSKEHNWNSNIMSKEYKKLMRERRSEMILKNNCHPAKTVVIVLVQAPIWVCLSSALRNFVHMLPMRDTDAQIIYLQMKASSVLWLSDLTLPDETWTIPICLAVTNLSLIQINYLARKPPKGIGKFILIVFRCFSVLMAYISSTVPSIISLFWLTSSSYGLLQNIILSTPKVRKFLGIPILEKTRNPLQYFVKKMTGIIHFFKY